MSEPVSAARNVPSPCTQTVEPSGITAGSTATIPSVGQRPEAVASQPPSSMQVYIVTRAGPLQATRWPIGGQYAVPTSSGSIGPTADACTQPARRSDGSQ